MKWYWKVRIYNTSGQYAHACVETERDLAHIDLIQDTYKVMTNCKMLLEGMSEEWFEGVGHLQNAFFILWDVR
jgi:hypothetical protein